MKLEAKDLICEPKFEREELKGILICLTGILAPWDNDKQFVDNFNLTVSAILYLFEKLGGKLDPNELEGSKNFAEFIKKK